MFAVIRIRGTGRIEKGVVDTMKIMHLSKTHSCVVLEKNAVSEGMLKKVKDYVTWGEIKPELLKQLKEKYKQSESESKDKKESKAKAKESKTESEKNKSKSEKSAFNLPPPKGGFSRKGIIKGFKQGGELGYRGEKINELLERMIA